MENDKVHRSFIIGDEWNYFKIYTGYKQADVLLINAIYPLSQFLLSQKIIDKWFFIRYADPDLHIRVRFHSVETSKVLEVIYHFNKMIKEHFSNGLIWKIQSDTYNREIEKYSKECIIDSESLFFSNSVMVCKTISYIQNNRVDENLRWLIGMKMIDAILTSFGFQIEHKENLLYNMQLNFKEEFNITTEYKKQFGERYRHLKSQIEKTLSQSSDESVHKDLIIPIEEYYDDTRITVKCIKEKIKINTYISIDRLMVNYIHMTLNRLFRIDQRKHELVIYDYLYRYYHSQRIRFSKI